ncbi:hypothetical protein KC361_g9127 [Hortaea werneckii]|nr:hypothetical protein KC361_g9127 [Hortaea werneckii]
MHPLFAPSKASGSRKYQVSQFRRGSCMERKKWLGDQCNITRQVPYEGRRLIGCDRHDDGTPSPNTLESSVSVDDRPNTLENPEDTHTLWAFSRNYNTRAHERVFLIPDFNYWSWRGVAGSFAEMRARSKELDEYISDKIPKAVWRGALWTNPEIRGPLLKVTKNKSWADVYEFDWLIRSNFIPMEDFCRYAFLVHTEGRSWSGRLKYLLDCESVTMIHEREWTAHYYHLLDSEGRNQNFVSVKRNFSGLGKRVQYYLGNQDEAQRIADNAVATFRDRYLTLAAETCYWRRLIEGRNEVADSPDIYEDMQMNVSGAMQTKRMLRGIAFEELVLSEIEQSGRRSPKSRRRKASRQWATKGKWRWAKETTKQKIYSRRARKKCIESVHSPENTTGTSKATSKS